MPAGFPSGLDRRFLLGDRLMRNSGADVSVNYQAAAFDPASEDLFIAGNNDYVGLMTRGIFGEVVQGAALPATNNTMLIAALNAGAGGWLLLDNNNSVFRGNAGLTAWVNITPPAATARRGLVEYNGRLFTATNSLNLPDRDIEFSDDNGATWDSNPGIFTGINVNLTGIFTDPRQTRLVAIAAAGPNAAFTTAVDGASGWTLFSVDNLGVGMNHAALSADGLKLVIVSANGRITTTSGFVTFFQFPVDNNPFVSAAAGTAIQSVVYVTQLAGFLLMSASACAFIPEADMEQIFVGSYLGGAISSQRCVVSDGVQALWPTAADEAICTLRRIGQLGKT